MDTTSQNQTSKGRDYKECLFFFLVIPGFVFTLLFLLLVALGSRDAARRTACCPDDVSMALRIYHEVHGSFPPAYTTDADGTPLHSWRVLILPYMGQQELYDKICLDEPWDSPYNSQFHKPAANRHGLVCQSREEERFDGLAHYQMVIGPDTISDGSGSTTYSDITNQESFLIVETSIPVLWMSPHDLPQSALAHGVVSSRPQRGTPVVQGIGSPHWQSGGGAWVALTGGGTRFLSKDTPPEVLLEYSRVKSLKKEDSDE